MSPCLELVLDLIWDSSVKFLVGRSWLRNSRDLDPRSREDLEERSLEKSLGWWVTSLDRGLVLDLGRPGTCSATRKHSRNNALGMYLLP